MGLSIIAVLIGFLLGALLTSLIASYIFDKNNSEGKDNSGAGLDLYKSEHIILPKNLIKRMELDWQSKLSGLILMMNKKYSFAKYSNENVRVNFLDDKKRLTKDPFKYNPEEITESLTIKY